MESSKLAAKNAFEYQLRANTANSHRKIVCYKAGRFRYNPQQVKCKSGNFLKMSELFGCRKLPSVQIKKLIFREISGVKAMPLHDLSGWAKACQHQ